MARPSLGSHWEGHWRKQLLLSDSQEMKEEKKKEANGLAVNQESQNYVGNIMDPELYSLMMKLFKVTSCVLCTSDCHKKKDRQMI